MIVLCENSYFKQKPSCIYYKKMTTMNDLLAYENKCISSSEHCSRKKTMEIPRWWAQDNLVNNMYILTNRTTSFRRQTKSIYTSSAPSQWSDTYCAILLMVRGWSGMVGRLRWSPPGMHQFCRLIPRDREWERRRENCNRLGWGDICAIGDCQLYRLKKARWTKSSAPRC